MNEKEKVILKVTVKKGDDSPFGRASQSPIEMVPDRMLFASTRGGSPLVAETGATLGEIGDFLSEMFNDPRIKYALKKFEDPELYKDYDPYTASQN